MLTYSVKKHSLIDTWTIEDDEVDIEKERLGKGNFGEVVKVNSVNIVMCSQVFKGSLDGKTVAVKKIRVGGAISEEHLLRWVIIILDISINFFPGKQKLPANTITRILCGWSACAPLFLSLWRSEFHFIIQLRIFPFFSRFLSGGNLKEYIASREHKLDEHDNLGIAQKVRVNK